MQQIKNKMNFTDRLLKEQQEIIKEQQKTLKEYVETIEKMGDKIIELTDRANWTNEECVRHLLEKNYTVIAPKCDCEIISQQATWENSDYDLYWGATDGYLTIWRTPQHLVLPNDYFGRTFGNKRCLGEEWGSLTSACFKTITQEMIDKRDFEEEQCACDNKDDKPEAEAKPSEETDEETDEGYENVKICCKCEEKFEDGLNSPMCDECYEKLGDDKESRLRKYSQEVHGMDGERYAAFRAVVFK